MEKININGYIFNNFGENNYSYGMELVSVGTNSSKESENLTKRVLNGEFPGVHLNPSAPYFDDEFFAVFGTEEQYKKFYAKQKESQISKKMIDKFGWGLWPSPKVTNAYKEELLKNYKDWWEK
jgi:hypothetical protein